MGKTVKVKTELGEVTNLLDVVSVLKDVATNRYFQNMSRKEDVSKYLEAFQKFFRAVAQQESTSPLIDNHNPGTDILVFTSEASFMSQLNARICNTAFEVYQKHKDARVICLGFRGKEKFDVLGMKVERLYRDLGKKQIYSFSFEVRDYLIDRVLRGETGQTIAVYAWPKSFSLIKPAAVQLLPAKAILSGGEDEEAAGKVANAGSGGGYISESSTDGLMRVLADAWVSCRIYEMFGDIALAEAAAQAQQLDAAIDGLKKEKKTLTVSLRKSIRADLNAALSEVSTSSRMCSKK